MLLGVLQGQAEEVQQMQMPYHVFEIYERRAEWDLSDANLRREKEK